MDCSFEEMVVDNDPDVVVGSVSCEPGPVVAIIGDFSMEHSIMQAIQNNLFGRYLIKRINMKKYLLSKISTQKD